MSRAPFVLPKAESAFSRQAAVEETITSWAAGIVCIGSVLVVRRHLNCLILVSDKVDMVKLDEAYAAQWLAVLAH